MRILIGLHHVILGGDTINALELAGRLRDRGHAVTLLALTAADGSEANAPLLQMAADRDLDVQTFVRPHGMRSRIRLVQELRAYARRERFDVVHSFGHQDTYYAFLAMYGLTGVPLVVNDYANSLTEALPRRVPLVVGTREVLDEAKRVRTGGSHLIEPPVDVEHNAPDAVSAATYRRRLGVSAGDVLIVIVSRLHRTLKLESLRGAIDAVRTIADPAVRLVIVGEGHARADLVARAAKANAEIGRESIILPGALADPRVAYAAADIVVGMGHSALRALAFAKPVVVVGEQGFALPFAPETRTHFYYYGFYGLGNGGDIGPRIADHLRPLIADAELRARLGDFGRHIIVQHYSLDVAARRLEEIYREAADQRRSWITWLSDAGHVARCYAPAKARRLSARTARRLGRGRRGGG